MKKSFFLLIIACVLVLSCKNKDIVTNKMTNQEKCLLQSVFYYNNGIKQSNYRKYIYDAERYLIKEIEVNQDCPNEGCYYTYEYNEAKNITKKSYFSNNKLVSSILYEFDKAQNNTKTSSFDKNNIEEWSITKEYNINNKVSISKHYEKGILYSTSIYTYDSKNNVVEVKSDNLKSTFQYDNNNNLINETISDNNGIVNITLYKYDTKNREIQKRVLNNKSNPQFESETSYNDSERTSTSKWILYSNNIKTESVEKRYFDGQNREIKYQSSSNNVLIYESNSKYNSEGYIINLDQIFPVNNSKSSVEYIYTCK